MSKIKLHPFSLQQFNTEKVIDIPLGNLVGGAFRAQAYIIAASSSQVPCTLPQSLNELPQNSESQRQLQNKTNNYLQFSHLLWSKHIEAFT